MFNGYNDTPLISYNEFQQEGEKKQDSAQKWSYGHVAGVPTHAQSRQSEYWLGKPNVLEITAPVHAPSECNCSECYSSENNSYQGDSARNRPWLPRRIAVPVNGANESCKLPGNHQWSNIGLTNPESCMIGNNFFPAQHAQHMGGKNPFHRSFQNGPLGEFHQPGVITSMKTLTAPDGHVLLKDKKETSSNSATQEMAFYGQTGGRQTSSFCPPTHDLTRNLEKRLDNRNCDPNFCDLNEKYTNVNHYRHPNNLPSCPLDSHISRSPVMEPYLKTVPLNLNHNRVPLNGHRSFKENLPKSCIDESLIRSGNGSRKIMNSDGYQDETERHERMVFQLTKDGILAETLRAQQQLQGLPSSMETDFKTNQMVMDYSRFGVNRDISKHYENKTEADMPKKFLGESDGRQLDYYRRNSLIDSTKRNGPNSFQENKKDCIVNQLGSSEQPFGTFNRLNQNSEINFLEANYPKASVYYPKEPNVDKILKPEKCGYFQDNPALIQRNGQNFLKNVDNPGFNGCLNRPPLFINNFQDHCFVPRRQNPFPYQNDSASCRNFVRPEFSCQSYNVPNRSNYFHSFSGSTVMRNDGNHVNHRNVPPRMPDCGSANSASFVSSGNNSFVFDPYCQPNGNFDKSHQQQIYPGIEQPSSNGVSMYSGVPHVRLEEPRVENLSESKEVTHLESIKSKNLSKNGSNKISPLRLLRKKKSGCQKNETVNTSPVPKNNSKSTPALDVRKFWSTWADEEDDNTTATTTTTTTEMVVLDCQNINPEQAELLQLYGSGSIHNLDIKNGSPVFSKSSSNDKKFSSESPIVENHVQELNSIVKEFPLETGMKMNGYDIKKDINENQIDIINEIQNTESQKPFEKSSIAPSSSKSCVDMAVKNELNKASEIHDTVNLNVAFQKNMENPENQNLVDYGGIEETHFVEKFDFLKTEESYSTNRETNSAETIEIHDETKDDGNGFLFQAEKIVSVDVKSPDNIVNETLEKKSEVGVINNGENPEKILNSEMKLSKDSNANETISEPPLEETTSPTMDENSLSDSPKSETRDLPNLPTSEYRRNKFLDYSDGKFSIEGEISGFATKDEKVMKMDGDNKDSLEKVIESEVDTAVSKNEISSVTNKCYKRKCLTKSGRTSLNDNPCDELSKNDIQQFKSESEFNDVKLKKETGLENFEMDSILQKLSKINFDNSQIKAENVADDVTNSETDLSKVKSPKKIRFKGKKMKRNKKKFKFKREIGDGQTTADKISAKMFAPSEPTIEFSIQKSHDLKISFKVLNSQGGDGKREKSLVEAKTNESQIKKSEIFAEDLRIETTTGQKDENDVVTTCPTLFSSDAKTKFKPDFPNRRISLNDVGPIKSFASVIDENDHSIAVEKDPKEKNLLAKVEDVNNKEDPPSSPTSANYFQVTESTNSAKIKLTFKRQKGDSDGDYKISDNSSIKDFESEDALNTNNDPISFTTANSANSTLCMDLLSGVEFVKPESKSENVFGIVNGGNEDSEKIQTNFVSEDSSSMSLFPRILNSESEENDEKIVKYSKCSSVGHFTYLQSDIIEIDDENRNEREEEKSFSEKLSPRKIVNENGKSRLGSDENLITDFLEESQFVEFGEFSKKKEIPIENNTNPDQLIGKELINCEDGDRLYVKYCKSPVLTDPDTLIKGENPDEVRSFQEANSKDALNGILACGAEKHESLGVTEDSKNDIFNLDQSAHETQAPTQGPSNGSSLTGNFPSNLKNEENSSQLFTGQDSNSKIKDFQIFNSFNWPECREEKENSSTSDLSQTNFNVENNYCSSEALEIILEKTNSKRATENEKVSEVDDSDNGEFETPNLNENLPKPVIANPGNECSVDDSLFASVEPFQVLSKDQGTDQSSNPSEKRWFNSFNSEIQPNENDNNNFEFIIDPVGKILPSDSEKMENYANSENVKIDEINEALEAIFQETDKTTDDYTQKDETPMVGLHENGLNDELVLDYKNVSNDIESVLNGSEQTLKTFNQTPEDSEGVTKCDEEVKDQDEITQSKCDSVISQAEVKLSRVPSFENNDEKNEEILDLKSYKKENETISTMEDGNEIDTDEPECGRKEQNAKDPLIEEVSVETFTLKNESKKQKENFSEFNESNESNESNDFEIINPENDEKKEYVLCTNEPAILDVIAKFGPPQKINRRNSWAANNDSIAQDKNFPSKNESKIKFTYSEWKSRFQRAKSCPLVAFTVNNTDRNVDILDIPVEEIPLPPGEAPPGNCFDLTKFNRKKKTSSCDLWDSKSVFPNEIKKFVSGVELLPEKNSKSVNIVENLEINDDCFANEKNSVKTSSRSSSSNSNISRSLSHSEICLKKESEFQSVNNDIMETVSSQNDVIISEIDKCNDLNEAEKQDSAIVDNSLHVPERKEPKVRDPEIIKSDANSNRSRFIIPESIKPTNIPDFSLDDEKEVKKEFEETEIPVNIAFSNEEDCVLSDEIEKLSEKFCENESKSISSDINGGLTSEPETSSGMNYQESEEIEESNLHKDCEELDSKLTCDDFETEETEELDFEKVEIVVGDSSCRTGFQDDIFTKDGFYECEDIPTSEDLPNGNVEEEKVSDDAKFRHMMQNCLDNAKKFLNVSNLKLFSSSVDDLLELDCRSTAMEREMEKSSGDTTNHIPRDVLLTSCEDGVGDDFELSHKLLSSDLSMEFIPSFGSSNNLCPEVLPVDNWPYLEEEVPSSPVKPNAEDVIPFIENNSKVVSPRRKKSELKNDKQHLNGGNDINKLNVEKKLSDFDSDDLKYKKFRRKSLICPDNMSSIKNAKISGKRRKTLESFVENPLTFRKKINKSVNDFKLEITEWKNGLEKIERFWLNTKDLKCRLNLDRIVDEERTNKYGSDDCPKENQKINDSISQNFEKPKNDEKLRPVDYGQKILNGYKSISDYKTPTWQPKVVLFRISKKQIKRIQKNQSKNYIEKKCQKDNGFSKNKHSIEEKEKISREIVEVLESREEFPVSAFKKQKLSSTIEVSSNFPEQVALEQSIEKVNPNFFSKKENNKIDKNNFSKKCKNECKVKSDHVQEGIVYNENPLLGKTDDTENKTLASGEKHRSINSQMEGDVKKPKKSRFRNLHGKKKTDSELNSFKSSSPTSRNSSRSLPDEKVRLVDAERRLSEIFRDFVPASESVGKHQKTGLPMVRDKVGTKRQSSDDGNVSGLPEKKRKNEMKENFCHENGKIWGRSNASDRTVSRKEVSVEKTAEQSSSSKSEKKRGKSHGEKISSSESSRRDKHVGSRSSKPTAESYKTNKDKFNGKRSETPNETIKSQIRPTTSKKRNDESLPENQTNSKEKQSKQSKNERDAGDDDKSDFDNESGQDDDQEKTKDTNLAFSEDDSEDETSKKPWMCNVCGFNNEKERMAHIKGHPFHCQSCHLAFRTEAHFVSHLTKKHKDIRNQHHCLLCELSFDTEKEYLRHLKTREHVHLETVEKNTINTLFTLLTGQPCPVLGLVELRPEWLPNQAGTVHFYHQATPLSLALQYLKMHHDLSTYSKDSLTHRS